MEPGKSGQNVIHRTITEILHLSYGWALVLQLLGEATIDWTLLNPKTLSEVQDNLHVEDNYGYDSQFRYILD